MAARTSFKQQCPSCEAMIPIRDDSLIGKKIDCPKCKYRFVVEEPDEPEAEVEEAEETPAEKTKPGAKKKRAVADADQKGKKSNKMILVLGLAGAGVLLLIVAGVLIFGGVFGSNEGKKTVSPTPVGRSPGGRQANTEPEDDPNKDKKKEDEPNKPVDVVTNLLPNDTELVINLSPQEILKSPIGKPAFETPGAFQKKMFQDNFGLPIESLERILVAANVTQKWFFVVIKTSAPIPKETVQKTMGLKKAENPPMGQDYFVMTSDWLAKELNRASELTGEKGKADAAAAAARIVGVRFHADKVLVVADVLPLKQFLANNSKPTPLYKPAEDKQAEGNQAGPGGRAGGPGGPGGGPGGAMGDMMGRMRGMGRGGSGMPGGMSGGTSASAAPPPPSDSYLTVNPQIKAMLDRVEAKGPTLFSAAMDMTPVKEIAKGHIEYLWLQDNFPKVSGISLGMKEKITAMFGLEYPDENMARTASQNIQAGLQDLVQSGERIRFKVEVNGAGGGMMGGMRGGMDMMRMRQGGPGGGPPGFPGPRPGGPGQPQPGAPAPNPRGGGQGPPGFGPPGFGRNPSEQDYIGTAKFEVGSHEKTLQLSVEISLKQPAMDWVQKQLEMGWTRARGEIAMARMSPVPHDLAKTLRAYRERNGQFPRGAFPRKPTAERKERPWPPDQRVSWMADLLPFLGYNEIYSRIDFEKSWRDKENYLPSMALIPEFLDGRDPNRSRYIRYPGMGYETAATDFVGVAGIGLDAADYSNKDPAVAKLLGIFGYDRVTRADDIKDGLQNTIVMLQIPAAYPSPWIAGGGSTVRGIPETKSVQPFVSVQPDGKKGTIALMADGSVRFIPDTIDDKVFQAMCTYKGAEKVDVEKNTTLIPDLRSEEKAEAAPPGEDKKK